MILWCPSHEATTVSIVWINLTAPSGHFKNFVPAFNGRADYTQLIKRFRESPEAERRYSPPQVVGIDKVWRQGSPRTRLILTRYVERQNLTMPRSEKTDREAAQGHGPARLYVFARPMTNASVHPGHSAINVTRQLQSLVRRKPWFGVPHLVTASNRT